MPEGPEIRRAADRIAAVLVGRRIDEAWTAFADLVGPFERLSGTRVTAVDTRGKAMLTRFDCGLTLYSHNQLYGRWYTTRRGRRPQTRRSLRVALHTREHSALLYSASDVELLDRAGLAAHPFLRRLGPDLLDPSLTAGDIADRLRSDRFRRRSLAALYLDQAFLAGLGNYLRSEILNRAGAHPAAKPARLDDATIERIARETLAVGRRSYRTGGITLTDAALRELGGRRRGRRFWVFDREGQGCRDCGTGIERAALSGRRIYYCPRCQPISTDTEK